MTLDDEHEDSFADGDLVQRLLLLWRARTSTGEAPWQLTVGRGAGALCAEVVRTLEHGTPSPGLGPAFRAWGTGVPSAVSARAALQCLVEAVGELVVTEYGGFRPRGLDPVLEEAARESVVGADRRTVPVLVDELTGCPGREVLEHDLARAVPEALGAAGELTVAVLELADARDPGGGQVEVPDWQLLSLLATMRRLFGGRRTIYRTGTGAFAVMVPGAGTVDVGELVLLATAFSAARFFWGRAALRGMGTAAMVSPTALLARAEADLERRRKDYAEADQAVSRRRQLSVVGSAAAGLALVAGVAAALGGTSGTPASHAALQAPSAPAAPAPRPGATPTTTAPAPTPEPPAVVTPPPAPPASTVSAVSAPAPTGTGAANAVLVSYQAPAPASTTTTTPPPPKPTTPKSTPTPTTTTTPPAHGHSGAAPGHTKGGPKHH